MKNAFTNAQLKAIAAEIAMINHYYYGCLAGNRNRIYEALKLVRNAEATKHSAKPHPSH